MKPIAQLNQEKNGKPYAQAEARDHRVQKIPDVIEPDQPPGQIFGHLRGKRTSCILVSACDFAKTKGEYRAHDDAGDHGSMPRYAVVEHHAKAEEPEQQQDAHAAGSDDGEQQKADSGDADKMHYFVSLPDPGTITQHEAIGHA